MSFQSSDPRTQQVAEEYLKIYEFGAYFRSKVSNREMQPPPHRVVGELVEANSVEVGPEGPRRGMDSVTFEARRYTSFGHPFAAD